MAVVWTKGSPEQFNSMGDRLKDKIVARVAEQMVGVVEEAVADAKDLTRDRVDTGKMLESITWNVQNGAREVIGRFGFTQEREDYFVYQTVTGFTHWLSGEYIEPTYALQDAYENSKIRLRNAIMQAIRGAW